MEAAGKRTAKTARRKKTPVVKAAARRRRKSGSRAAARQAHWHTKTRRDHSAETAEDYVELIAQLIRRHGEARTVDIAER